MHKLSTCMNVYEKIDYRVKYIWESKQRYHLAHNFFVKNMIVYALFCKPNK